jgi:hypothetical protein
MRRADAVREWRADRPSDSYGTAAYLDDGDISRFRHERLAETGTEGTLRAMSQNDGGGSSSSSSSSSSSCIGDGSNVVNRMQQ